MENTGVKPVIVPFGKYKGQPLEAMLQNESYVDWLTAQEWFREKYSSLYTLVVNNYHVAPVDTPEHNQMQVKYLSENYRLKLAYLLTDKELFTYGQEHFNKTFPDFLVRLKEAGAYTVEFEKNLSRLDNNDLLDMSPVKFEHQGIDVKYDICYGYGNISVDENTYRRAHTLIRELWGYAHSLKLRIELKPSIGDDFPSVLRQAKASKANVLVAGKYNGTGASEEEFKAYFVSQGITVISECDMENTDLPAYDRKLSFKVARTDWENSLV